MPSPFTSRPEKTFLVEADDLHYRIDLRRGARGYEVVHLLHEEVNSATPRVNEKMESAPDSDYFSYEEASYNADWVKNLLRQSPKPAPEVIILSTAVTAMVLEIPSLGGEDWDSAIELEAQSLTGLYHAEASLASNRIPAGEGLAKFWVVQTPIRILIALREAVASTKKSRLVQVGHPGGIRLDPKAAQLECWPDFRLFHPSGGERLDLRGWTGTDAVGQAENDADVIAARRHSDFRELTTDLTSKPLTASSAPVPPALPAETVTDGLPDYDLEPRFDEDESPSLFSLHDAAVAKQWADRLAASLDPLSGRLGATPLVDIPKPPPAQSVLVGTTVAITAVALLFSVGHYFVTQIISRSLEAELVEIKKPTEKLAAAKARITALKKQITSLDEELESISKDGDVDPFAHRQRLANLLGGVAAGTSNDAVVLSLSPDSLTTRLTGIASTPTGAQSFASRIDEKMAGDGWRAALTRRTAKLLQNDGGPWEFEILLSPARPVTSLDDTGEKAAPTIDGTIPPPALPGPSATPILPASVPTATIPMTVGASATF